MPESRPTSPFLILLFGAAATALAAEWLRFQWSFIVAAVPVVLGTAATLMGVSRAYRLRRGMRRGTAATLPLTARAAEGPPGGPPEATDSLSQRRIHLGEARDAPAPAMQHDPIDDRATQAVADLAPGVALRSASRAAPQTELTASGAGRAAGRSPAATPATPSPRARADGPGPGRESTPR